MSAFEPQPAMPARGLPWAGSGFGLLRDPTRFLQARRTQLGDTFALDVFGRAVLFVFSPAGVRDLWALPEAKASKGLADFALLRHKVPDELFAGRRTFPHGLFARDDVEDYLVNLEEAIAWQIDELGGAGEFEVFALARRLTHRMGLASWGGSLAASPRFLDRLIPLLDRLDSSESFVHPHKMFWTLLTQKRSERRALRAFDAVFAELLAAHARNARKGEPRDDLFARICAAWHDVPSPDREQGIGRDVLLVQMASQSNLFAAMGWTLVHLLERPELLAAVRAGDVDLLDRCALESIRLRQRSIVLRRVLAPCELADEHTRYRLSPGSFAATMLSLTNPTALPGLDGFDPDHYLDRRFQRTRELSARELVTTFGHGKHSCPAQAFSIRSIRCAVLALLQTFDLRPAFEAPRPLRRQIGGVARADRPCRVRYERRAAQATRSDSWPGSA